MDHNVLTLKIQHKSSLYKAVHPRQAASQTKPVLQAVITPFSTADYTQHCLTPPSRWAFQSKSVLSGP